MREPNFVYEFRDNIAGNADGRIIFDGNFCDEEKVEVFWAKRRGEEYSALEGYTPLLSVTAGELARGIDIDKSLVIPDGADSILARADGGEYILDVPKEKLSVNKEEPRYTVAFTADYHLGGWGSDECAKEGLVKAREDMNKYADFVVTAGDLIQWHGAYSAYEFRKYNWDGEKYGDNGETSEEYIGQGVSQWEIAKTYLDGFTIPFYHCQGNHDICDADNWSLLSARTDHFGIFLKNWIEESEKSGKYKSKIERDESVHYYDADIFGDRFIFTEAPRPTLPHDRFGEDQLYWLDKKLFEYEATGKPLFVMGHCPLVEGLNFGSRIAELSDIDKLMAVLEKHPTVIYVSGHTHYTLDTLEKNAVNGKQKALSHLHSGGMTTTLIPYTKTQIHVTHEAICDVYSDHILVKGRDSSEGKWVSLGRIKLDFAAPCESGKISINEAGENDGVITLAATAENSDGISFEWYTDGNFAARGDKLEVRKDKCGYVALRATDKNGGFCSVIYEINK